MSSGTPRSGLDKNASPAESRGVQMTSREKIGKKTEKWVVNILSEAFTPKVGYVFEGLRGETVVVR